MRQAQRRKVQVPVDVRPLKTADVDNILYGQGCGELVLNSLSLRRPRHGMQRCLSEDLSVSGLRLRAPSLKPGTAAMVDLHLPDEGVVVKALVEVVWVQPQAEGEEHAGLRFAALPEQGARRLQAYLSQNLSMN